MAHQDPKTRDLLVHAGGWVLLGTGVALLVLPGPGIPLVIAGLAILGRRHAWARSAAHRIRQRTRNVIDRVRPPRSGGKAPEAGAP
ncbi:MAG TPA: PGPGW domain-containing protein [Myxococcales bacterium]|nr:PGPGW domain-containing protein [Myxococcales bacterium]